MQITPEILLGREYLKECFQTMTSHVIQRQTTNFMNELNELNTNLTNSINLINEADALREYWILEKLLEERLSLMMPG